MTRVVEGTPRWWPPVLVALASVVLLAGGWWFFARHVPALREREVEQWRGRLTAMAEDRKLALDLWLADGVADARTIASFPTLRALLSTRPAAGPVPEGVGGPDHLAQIVSDFIDTHGLRAATVVSASLDVVQQVGAAGTVSPDAAVEGARSAIETRAPFARVTGDGHGRTAVVFVAPVADGGPGDGPIGAVLLEQDPEDFLYPLLRREPVPTSTGETMLAGLEEGEIVFVHATRRGGFAPLALRRPLHAPGLAMSRALESGAGFGEFVDYLGVPVLAATQRLAHSPWGLVVKVDVDEALEPYRRRRRMHLLAALALLLGSSGVAFGLLRVQRATHQVELHATRARMGAMLDRANDPILFLAPDGRITEASRRAEEFYGLDHGDLVGRSIADLRTEEERSRAPEHLARIRERGELIQDTVHRAAGGRAVPVEVSSRLVDAAGDQLIVSLVRDLSERRAQEARIRELEGALRGFFGSNVIGILLGDVHGAVLEANDALLSLVGYTREQLERKELRWSEITPPEHLPRDHEAVAEARSRGVCTPYEKQYVRSDGSRVWVLVGFALLEPDRERSVAFILDLTRRKEAEAEVLRLNAVLEERVRERTAELETANRELEAFAYSVSHDLRTPLRAIGGFARILAEDYAERLDPEGRRVLGVVRDNVGRMGELIEDLLALSRAGRRPLRRDAVDMGELARTAFRELAEHEPLEGLELRIGRLEPAEGDEGLLRQVWTNLLANALKFTRPKPRRVIDVEGRADRDIAWYTIHDNGVGFDMRYHDRLFGVFQRLHPEDEFEGTGVGLALVRRIVARHGGEVEAEGRPGEGATFRFSLPRARGEV